MRIGLLWAVLSVALVLASALTLHAADKEGADGGHHKAGETKVGKLFKKLDTDHDGKLSPDELKNLPGHMKAGADGKVSEKDLETFITEMAKEDANIDLFAGWIDLSVYTILVFLILFTILRAFAWGPIMTELDKREKRIAQSKIDAENARKEATELRTRLEQELAKVNDQIRQMMDKARADAQQTAAEELARGKGELQAERERLMRELRLSTDQALQNIWVKATDLATLISTKAVGKNLSEQDHRALLDEALNEFKAAAQHRREDIEGAHA